VAALQQAIITDIAQTRAILARTRVLVYRETFACGAITAS
jgi:hypothetical protein